MQGNNAKNPNNLALRLSMYKEENDKQQKLEDFYLPFGGHLDENNRWIILSNKLPWKEIEKDYAAKFSASGMGAPAISLRIALGALIIKEKLQLSDREVVEQIRENPYLQYFLGLDCYLDEQLFDSSMMVHFRKRLDADMVEKTNEILFKDSLEADRRKKRQIRKKLKKMKG